MKDKLIIGFVTFIFVTLIFRLVDIQLLNGKSFEKLADNNKTYRVNLPEERGVFLDRYNRPLVYNKPVYFKLDSADSLYSEKTRINHDQALDIMSQDSDLIRMELERMYLYPKSISHVLGYIGSVSVEDLDEDSSLYISDKIGKFGLEKEFQDFLKGSKGSKIFEINALGEKQRLIAEEKGFPGKNIPTTLDPYLSEISLSAMGDNKGAVVILDASNSEVLSLVSTPAFDNSTLSESFSDEKLERKRMLDITDSFTNPQKLFFNRAISGAYPPGSIFKIITALAGLEGKKIDKDTSVLDEGVLKVGEYSYANWYFTQFGRKEGDISLLRAISRSNDIYFYKVAEWVGPEKLREMAELFSLGQKTGIQLQSEVLGVIPDPEWKQRVIGERWFLGNTYHMGIGQGNILVSPIQIAQMVQGVANNGNLCKATLIKDSFGESGMGLLGVGSIFGQSRCGEVGVLEENTELVLQGMLDACSAGGTGFPFFNYNSEILGDRDNDVSRNGVGSDEELESDFGAGGSVNDLINKGAVACKTGTSEFGGVDENGYRNTHAWFAAVVGTKDLVKEAIESRKKTLLDELENGGEIVGGGEESVQLGENEASGDANEKEGGINRDLWLDGVEKYGFPDKIVILVLVESDEINPHKEGSKDAGPVAKEIFDWVRGE
jgi:penicillin-binding protein 2